MPFAAPLFRAEHTLFVPYHQRISNMHANRHTDAVRCVGSLVGGILGSVMPSCKARSAAGKSCAKARYHRLQSPPPSAATDHQKLCPLTKAQGTAQGKTRQVLFPAAPQLHATQAADL